jgi:carbamate kinase
MTKRGRPPIAVLAFGGNAILPPHTAGTQEEQQRFARRVAGHMADVLAGGWRLLVTHGNGPQVGNELLRSEEAVTKVPPASLDHCVAKTKGEMGFMLELALRNELARRGLPRRVATLLTTVLVDRRDPGFRHPTKPIGPSYTRYRAQFLMREKRWPMVETHDHHFRRLVASPRPLAVVEDRALRSLLDAGYAVIAGGGGGIPVARGRDGFMRGVEAVVDKDYTAALLGRTVGARLLIIFTGVDRVALHFGKPNQKNLSFLSAAEARRHLKAGQFPPGSMGPKVEAALQFVRGSCRRAALVTSAEAWPAAMRGESGTRIGHSPLPRKLFG